MSSLPKPFISPTYVLDKTVAPSRLGFVEDKPLNPALASQAPQGLLSQRSCSLDNYILGTFHPYNQTPEIPHRNIYSSPQSPHRIM